MEQQQLGGVTHKEAASRMMHVVAGQAMITAATQEIQ